MHREVLQAPANERVDHINYNGLDNRRGNLRLCTKAQNQYAQPLRADNTSGYRGVSWHKATKRWYASIAKHGHQYGLGFHISREEAAACYNVAARKLFGDFAFQNPVDEAVLGPKALRALARVPDLGEDYRRPQRRTDGQTRPTAGWTAAASQALMRGHAWSDGRRRQIQILLEAFVIEPHAVDMIAQRLPLLSDADVGHAERTLATLTYGPTWLADVPSTIRSGPLRVAAQLEEFSAAHGTTESPVTFEVAGNTVTLLCRDRTATKRQRAFQVRYTAEDDQWRLYKRREREWVPCSWRPPARSIAPQLRAIAPRLGDLSYGIQEWASRAGKRAA
jgi:hypothetical protein